MTTVITVVCMHCQSVIRKKEGLGLTGESAGICDVCLMANYPMHVVAQVIASRGLKHLIEAFKLKEVVNG